MSNNTVRRLGVALAVLSCSAIALAQPYPAKPIRVLVPFAPGGAVDISARSIAPGLSEALGGTVVVENRVGAGGTIAADLVAKSAPDGYTLLMGSNSTLSVAPALYPKNPYDPTRDFAPISIVAATPFVLVVHPSVNARTVQELIALGQSKPGHLSMASGGTGSSNHLVGELFQMLTGTRFTHVPYKGAAQAGVDLVAGQVDVQFDQLASSANNIRAGKTRGLAVTAKTRSVVIPDVPTMAEAGVASFELTNITGLVAPARTPAELIERLNGAVHKVLGNAAVKERFAAIGVEAAPGSPAAFSAYIAEDFAKWQRVIREAAIKVE